MQHMQCMQKIRGKTGEAISMGYKILHGKYSKQKINVKSSTESELVGVGEYLPYNIWLMMFMGAQGYGIENNICVSGQSVIHEDAHQR